MPKRQKGKRGGGGGQQRYAAVRNVVAPITSGAFRDSHVVYVDDPDYEEALAQGPLRDVPVSTVLLVDRRAANNLKCIAQFWNNTHNPTQPGVVHTSHQTFNVMEWSGGKAVKKDAYIRYTMIRDENPQRAGKWIIHHLDSTEADQGREQWLQDLEDDAASSSEAEDESFWD